MDRHFMSPGMAKHMGGQSGAEGEDTEGEEAGDVNQSSGQHQPPHIHVHESEGKLHVRIMHDDKAAEDHVHEAGDTEGAAKHLHDHFGKEGQDHGYSGGEEMEDEHGYGSGV